MLILGYVETDLPTSAEVNRTLPGGGHSYRQGLAFFSQSLKDSKAHNFDKLIVYFVKKYQNVLAYIQQSFTFDRTLKKQLLLKVHS